MLCKGQKTVQKHISVTGIYIDSEVIRFSLTLGNYLSSVKGYKVLIINHSKINCFTDDNKITHIGKRLDGCEHPTIAGSNELLKERYDYIISIYSPEQLSGFSEYYKGNIRYIVGTLDMWSAQLYEKLLDSVDVRQCRHVSYSDNKKVKRYIEKMFNIKIKLIPWEINPLYLKCSNIAVISGIIE